MKAIPLAMGLFAVVALQEAPRTVSLRGTISESGGTGIEGVHVGIGSSSTRTASDGSFAIENIPPGEHVISISRNGYLLAGRTGERSQISLPVISLPSASAGRVRFATGEPVPEMYIEMVREGVIAGRVLTSAGQPAPGTSISVFQVIYRDGNRIPVQVVNAGVQTNDKGDYRVWGLPAGEYYLSFSQRSVPQRGVTTSTTSAKAYFPGVANPAQAIPIRVAAGKEVVATEVVLQEERTNIIPLRVILPPGTAPTSELMLLRIPLGSDPAFQYLERLSAMLEPRPGVIPPFRLPFSAPGRYNLFVGVRNGGAYYFAETEVDAPSTGEIHVELKPNVVVTGSLRFGGGAFDFSTPPITLRPIDVARSLAQTSIEPGEQMRPQMKSDGTFTMNLAEGEFVITPALPPGHYLADVRQGERSIIDSGLRVQSGNAEPLEIQIATNGGIIDGLLRNDRGQALSFVRVVLAPDNPRRRSFGLYRIETTDYRGRFEFKDLPPGGYKVFAWTNVPDGAWTNESYLAGYEELGVPVVVNVGAAVRGLNVRQIR